MVLKGLEAALAACLPLRRASGDRKGELHAHGRKGGNTADGHCTPAEQQQPQWQQMPLQLNAACCGAAADAQAASSAQHVSWRTATAMTGKGQQSSQDGDCGGDGCICRQSFRPSECMRSALNVCGDRSVQRGSQPPRGTAYCVHAERGPAAPAAAVPPRRPSDGDSLVFTPRTPRLDGSGNTNGSFRCISLGLNVDAISGPLMLSGASAALSSPGRLPSRRSVPPGGTAPPPQLPGSSHQTGHTPAANTLFSRASMQVPGRSRPEVVGDIGGVLVENALHSLRLELRTGCGPAPRSGLQTGCGPALTSGLLQPPRN